MFKGTMTNWPVQKLTQVTTQNSYNIKTQQTFRQTIFLCFSDFYLLFSSLNFPGLYALELCVKAAQMVLLITMCDNTLVSI